MRPSNILFVSPRLCTALLIGVCTSSICSLIITVYSSHLDLSDNNGMKKVEDVVEMLDKIPLTLPDCDKEIDEHFRCRVFLKQCIRSLDNSDIIESITLKGNQLLCEKQDSVR